jgi:NAD(P)-dependent dehydrogenase (short-subunit alcohol dehydrogenase family)
VDNKPRLAVITASATGIGLVVAESLCRDGWRVIMSDIDSDTGQIEAQRLGAEFRTCDVGDPRQLEQLFTDLNQIDLLINNAGIMGPSGLTWECPYDGWEETLKINLTSQFITCSLVVPKMIKVGRGVIINMSSVAGLFAWPTRVAYAVSKWGVLGLTKTLAKEVAQYGIRVNAILPGAVRGDRIELGIAAFAEANQISLEDARSHYLSRQPTGILVEPQEIADTIHFLASDKAKSITGQFIQVSGGFE